MKRGQYVRLSAFTLTDLRNTPDLSTLAMVSIPLWVLDGWLLLHVQPAGRIRLVARIREGKSCRGIFTSAPIIRVRSGYVLTADTLYQLLRVPPPAGETFAKFAYSGINFYLKTMKKGTYVRLIEMSAAPDTISGLTCREREWPAKKGPTVKPGQWLEGYLADDIVPANPIRFTRHIRGGRVRSAFRSSPVCVVRGNDVITEMSIYRILKVPPFDADKSLKVWE